MLEDHFNPESGNRESGMLEDHFSQEPDDQEYWRIILAGNREYRDHS